LLFAGRLCVAPVPYFRCFCLCRNIAGGRQKARFAFFAAFAVTLMRLPAGFFAGIPACGRPALK